MIFFRLETATAAVENKLDMRVFTCLGGTYIINTVAPYST